MAKKTEVDVAALEERVAALEEMVSRQWGNLVPLAVVEEAAAEDSAAEDATA